MIILLLVFIQIENVGRAAEDSSSVAPISAFEQANKLYEEGRYEEAAAAYQQMIDLGYSGVSLFFNLGNACYKAGNLGRAIVSYRQAQRLNPRDPEIRFNLQYVRHQVTGKEVSDESGFSRWLTNLTVNEWTLLFISSYWIWFLLLAVREARPVWRPRFKGYVATVGGVTIGLGLCLLGAARQWNGDREAVVISQEAVVRYGPLEESQVYYQLRDGSEVTVVDVKNGSQIWLQVRDGKGREGWLKSGDVLMLQPTLTGSLQVGSHGPQP